MFYRGPSHHWSPSIAKGLQYQYNISHAQGPPETETHEETVSEYDAPEEVLTESNLAERIARSHILSDMVWELAPKVLDLAPENRLAGTLKEHVLQTLVERFPSRII